MVYSPLLFEISHTYFLTKYTFYFLLSNPRVRFIH